MSRRGPSQDTTERNRVALKTLTKLESNKMCADCKRNKHPRWASWNLGIFVCIRCSGIHRSLGVHISKVKSIDLDSWTDEQLSSVVRWGNKRANKYWEHKLAEGHVPNDGKMESFIRTKYDSKRWAMDGPVPDPASLDDEEAGADDDVPLKVVQERARGNSVRNGTASSAAGGSIPQPPRTRPQDVDLFGDPSGPIPARPNTAEPTMNRMGPPKAPAAAPRQTRPGESLLGLDFFGGAQSGIPQRPSSTGPATQGQPGRTDLKQSILSLYASKPPAPSAPQQQQPTSNASLFGGMQSPPPITQTQQQTNPQALGGLGDAFSTLSFGSPQPTATTKPAAFAGFTSPTGHTRQTSSSRPNPLSGGNFFDTKPAPPPKATSPPSQAPRKESFGGDFGDFSTALASPSSTRSPPASAATSGMGDLFSLGSPIAAAPAPPPKSTAAPMSAAKSPPPIQASKYASSGAFNLSSPTQLQPPKPAPASQISTANTFSTLTNMDAWGSNDAWATPDPTPAAAPPPTRTQPSFVPPPQPSISSFKSAAPAPAAKIESPFDGGWGDPEPTPAPTKPAATSSSNAGGFGQSSAGGFSVQPDEEFGGWSHASPVASTPAPKQSGMGGGGGSDDLFGNVWG
ncbi:ARF GAP with effector function(s) [Friedmanniomyces endolithicus]|nr:ARF GAP with effector function(s) [Friedmanniomyces endolithicus]